MAWNERNESILNWKYAMIIHIFVLRRHNFYFAFEKKRETSKRREIFETKADIVMLPAIAECRRRTEDEENARYKKYSFFFFSRASHSNVEFLMDLIICIGHAHWVYVCVYANRK